MNSTVEVTDSRFEDCDLCNGSGVEVFGVMSYEHGCGFAHRDTDERPCPRCKGMGAVEYEVEPVTLEDLK